MKQVRRRAYFPADILIDGLPEDEITGWEFVCETPEWATACPIEGNQ